jgi:DNA mismatch repair protein MSH6
VSTLDALISLAVVSNAPGYCWPEIASSSVPILDIVDGRHPMLDLLLAERGDGEYIPNSVCLGNQARMMLVSGPNMGGKSTLLRQTCLISIIAQLGCKVPATKCTMTPVDRIFTRVGASDKILSGQSTFYVELAETASILLNATSESLCILDELGRGTATFDGTAIAHAVTDFLVSKICCRTMFATHYHSLVDDWEMDPRIRLGHLACIVQSEGNGLLDLSLDSPTVTFLYKLSAGSSPKSYGINVAKLAKVPVSVLELAAQYSKDFELKLNGNSSSSVTKRDFFVKFFDRLVSLAGTLDSNSMTDSELLYFVQELWRRFNHISR